MLNPQPHINTHERWIWRQFARQLLLNTPPSGTAPPVAWPHTPQPLPSWSPGERVATHEAYGSSLRTIGATNPRIVAIEGELDSSPHLQVFPALPAGPIVESILAGQQAAAPEQQMVAAAIALQTRGKIPFAAAFADSWTSTHDLIRMAAIEGAHIRLIGSHGGALGDEDGTSDLALEDIAMFRAIHNSTVLVPSDANQTASLVENVLDRPGVVYLRTLRTATPVIYQPGERFPIGGSRTLRSSTYDDVTLIGAGATVHEALGAADLLVPIGIRARVIDLYSVRPLDTPTLLQAAEETGNLIVAEDHWAEGGLGDAVLEALAEADSNALTRRLAVHTRPAAGRPEELLERTGVGRTWIATAARDLLEQPHHHDHHRPRRLAWALHR